MNHYALFAAVALLFTLLAAVAPSRGDDKPADGAAAAVRKAATFYASFDEEVRADFGGGELTPSAHPLDPGDRPMRRP